MNKTFAITAIALVAVIMGMSSVAMVLPQATANPGGGQGSHEIFWDMPCFGGPQNLCKIWVDLDHDGECSSGDNVFFMAKKAIMAAGFDRC